MIPRGLFKQGDETKAMEKMLLNNVMRILAILMVVSSMGCASAYYCTPCGSIDCRYDAGNPLPFTKFDPCVCHSEAASHYRESKPLSQELVMWELNPSDKQNIRVMKR